MSNFYQELLRKGKIVGWYYGDSVYKLRGRYYAVDNADGFHERVRYNDIEHDSVHGIVTNEPNLTPLEQMRWNMKALKL